MPYVRGVGIVNKAGYVTHPNKTNRENRNFAHNVLLPALSMMKCLQITHENAEEMFSNPFKEPQYSPEHSYHRGQCINCIHCNVQDRTCTSEKVMHLKKRMPGGLIHYPYGLDIDLAVPICKNQFMEKVV